VVNDFRHRKDRPSSLGLEVRKDLVCSFNDEGWPLPPTAAQRECAKLIGNVVAGAISTFFETDRQYL
jgi:hypothetical protein